MTPSITPSSMNEEKGVAQKARYGEYAGFVTRLVAFVIDVAIVIVIGAIITATGGLVNLFLNLHAAGLWVLRAITAGASFAFIISYYIVLWTLVGMTPGKRIMGLIIVTEDGGRMTIGRAVRRYVGYYLSSIFLLGYLWVLIDPKRQGFHDKLAGTVVIYDWPDSVLASIHTGGQPRWKRGSLARRGVRRGQSAARLSAQQEQEHNATPVVVNESGW